jgi:hypothetical protein
VAEVFDYDALERHITEGYANLKNADNDEVTKYQIAGAKIIGAFVRLLTERANAEFYATGKVDGELLAQGAASIIAPTIFNLAKNFNNPANFCSTVLEATSDYLSGMLDLTANGDKAVMDGLRKGERAGSVLFGNSIPMPKKEVPDA